MFMSNSCNMMRTKPNSNARLSMRRTRFGKTRAIFFVQRYFSRMNTDQVKFWFGDTVLIHCKLDRDMNCKSIVLVQIALQIIISPAFFQIQFVMLICREKEICICINAITTSTIPLQWIRDSCDDPQYSDVRWWSVATVLVEELPTIWQCTIPPPPHLYAISSNRSVSKNPGFAWQSRTGV